MVKRKRPFLHITPSKNWMNDPNGLIYFHGLYHMFYQCYPHALEWGTMHWGHLVSRDMVKWEEMPIAIYPSADEDRDGCFSGSALEINGQMALYYTGVNYVEKNPLKPHQLLNDELVCVQMMTVSEDGFTFDQSRKKVIIPRLDDITFGSFNRTHDPKVWKGGDGRFYLCLGSQFMENGGHSYIGELLLYRSEDGENWNYVNRYADKKLGTMWECPCIVKVDGQYVLIASTMHTKPGLSYRDNSVYDLIDFEEETCSVSRKPRPDDRPDRLYFMDYGLDFYAPHVFPDADGVPTMFAWLRMPEPMEGEEWIGMMTLPRVLSVKNDQLHSEVSPAIRSLFQTEISVEQINLEEPVRIQARINEKSCLNIGGCVLKIEDDCIRLDRSRAFCKTRQECQWTKFATPKLNGVYDLDIYTDVSVIEIYVNGGLYAMSSVLYSVDNGVSARNVDSIRCFKINKDAGGMSQ